MVIKEEVQYECKDCEASFTIIHDEIEDPQYCPFCACNLIKEDVDDIDKYFSDED